MNNDAHFPDPSVRLAAIDLLTTIVAAARFDDSPIVRGFSRGVPPPARDPLIAIVRLSPGAVDDWRGCR